MFTREISGLTLTKPVADGVFPNINGTHYRNDVSFLATLRALLHKRVPKEESVYLRLGNSRYGYSEVKNSDNRACARAFLRSSNLLDGDVGIIYVHSFDGNEESNAACFEVLDAGAVHEVLNGYTEMKDLATFFGQRKISARFYMNEEKKNVIIFIERLDTKRWHLLQSLIPRYFPWYFRDMPMEEAELNLVKSLTKRYAPDYEQAIEEFAKQFDFRTQIVRSALTGFEDRFEQDKLQNVRDQIANVNHQIDSLKERFSQYYKQIQDLTTQELGLIAKIRRGNTGEDSEFMEYFLCNKALNLVSVRGSTIEFIVTTTLSSFDPEVFDSSINNPESFFYRHYETDRPYGNDDMTDERIKKLMLAIFEDEELGLRVCAAYRLDFANGYYNGLQGYNYPVDMKDYTPNQHIQHYGCLGNNRRVIADAMMRRDYVAAMEACVSSAKNINFTEPNTGTYFMQKILSKNVGKIIQMPDGSNMTPLDAVKWLEERENQTETIKKTTEEENNEQAD